MTTASESASTAGDTRLYADPDAPDGRISLDVFDFRYAPMGRETLITSASCPSSVNRETLGPLLIAALAIVALGVGASALDSPTSSSDTAGRGGGSGGYLGEGSRFDFGQPAPIEVSSNGTIPKIVFQLLIAALVVAFLVGLYRMRDNPRTVVVCSLVLAGVLVLFYLGFRLLGTDLGSERNNTGRNGFLGERVPSLPGGGSSDATQTVTTDPLLLALVLAGVLVVGIVALAYSTGRNDSTPEPEPDVSKSETMTELGRVAGRAADRIADDADPANEVYRAWQEMTTHLEVSNPHSSTPGEFARAATDAGMAREDVTELTDLFQTIRYGGSTATTERETRAVAALRRIEDEYGDES